MQKAPKTLVLHSPGELRDLMVEAMRGARTDTGLIILGADFTVYHGSRKTDLKLRDRGAEPTHLTDSAVAAIRHVTLFEADVTEGRRPTLYTVKVKEGTALTPQFNPEFREMADGTVRFVPHLFGLHLKIWDSQRLEIVESKRVNADLVTALRRNVEEPSFN